MNSLRIGVAFAAALLGCATVPAFAQASTDEAAATIAKPAPKAVKKAPVKAAAKKQPAQSAKEVAAAPVTVTEGLKTTGVKGQYATGPTTLYDKDGKAIPTDPAAYPVGSAKK